MTQQTTSNLPALTGTEKQIAWAEQIRSKTLATVAAFFANAGLAGRPEAQQVYDLLDRQTEARWWIDSRHLLETHRSILIEAAKLARATRNQS